MFSLQGGFANSVSGRYNLSIGGFALTGGFSARQTLLVRTCSNAHSLEAVVLCCVPMQRVHAPVQLLYHSFSALEISNFALQVHAAKICKALSDQVCESHFAA